MALGPESRKFTCHSSGKEGHKEVDCKSSSPKHLNKVGSSSKPKQEDKVAKCPVCGAKHEKTVKGKDLVCYCLYLCSTFTDLSVDERVKALDDCNGCFKCIDSRHQVKECRARSEYGSNGYRGTEHTQ